MGVKAPRPAAIATAVLFALSCFGLILFVWISFGGPVPLQPQKYRFHAIFPNASQLLPNADVRIAGVDVGKVVGVRQAGERTNATMELNPKYAPLASDAHALLRQKTLLGETFVAITPGTRSAPKLHDGGVLSPANVGQTQGIDDVLGSFDAPTRKSFTRFLTEISEGLNGRGADLNSAIGNSAPAVDDLSRIVTVLDHQSGDVRRIVRDGGSVLDGLGRRQADLDALISSGNDVLGATAARDRQLTATVRALPSFLSQTRSALADLDTTGRYAAPVVSALRPVAPLVRPALTVLPGLADQLEGTFKDLVPLGPLARRAIPALDKVIAVVPPLGKALDAASGDAESIAQVVADYDKEAVAGFANLASSLQATTTNPDGTKQHYLRALIPITNESFYGQAERQPTNRHNPYPAPGALANLANGAFEAFSCANTSNAQTIPSILGSAPPCLVQKPWTFQGKTQSFPNPQPQP